MKTNNQAGFSILEMVVAAALMGALALASLSFFQEQSKRSNLMEFLGKREQIRHALMNQVLTNSDNCKCLFNGAAPFPVAGTAALTGFATNEIGRYHFPTPGDCAGVTIPEPLVSTAGVDGIKLVSLDLKNIQLVSGAYLGSLEVLLSNVKDMSGMKSKGIRIPVMLSTKPSGPGTVELDGCSMSEPPGGNSIRWAKAFAPPVFPVTFNVPAGVKTLFVTVTASQNENSGAEDVGFQVTSHFNYSTDVNPVPQWFATLSVGAGQNDATQIGVSATTSGIIRITNETQVTITKTGGAGDTFIPRLITVMGSAEPTP
jgi:type II secretory pathway pseudopilin PulG